MIKQYRTDYPGEFVITNTVFSGGKKTQEREWVENPLDVTSTNHRACCIAPAAIDGTIALKRIENHFGGNLGKLKMQLYGAENVQEHMNSDFLVVNDRERLASIIETGYPEEHVVYTNAGNCVAFPGECYLTPLGIQMLSEAITIWLACFDGHKDIYLYGYWPKETEQKLIHAVKTIMQTYSDVNFYHVSNLPSPDAWRRCINFRTMTRDEFISECDI